jgi:hypothetical protein
LWFVFKLKYIYFFKIKKSIQIKYDKQYVTFLNNFKIL